MGTVILKWAEICQAGESIHLARVSAPRPPLHSHDFYECFLVEAGQGVHIVGGKRTPLDPGMLVFMRPEHAHAYKGPARKQFTLTNIALSAGIMEDFMRRHWNEMTATGVWQPRPMPVVIQMTPLMHKRFNLLVDDLAWGNRYKLDAEFFLSALLRLISGPASQSVMVGLPDWLRSAFLYMEQADNLQAGVPRLVELCGRTPEHVSRCFQRYLKQTPSAWVNNLRIRYARQLLETTDLNITEVSFECGFETLSYFNRCFKRVTGLTPRAHRQSAERVSPWILA